MNDRIIDYLKNNFKVACFDMDGTLIQGTTSNLFFAKLLGVEEEVIQLEKQFKEGNVDSANFMVRVGEIMDELTVDYVKNNFHLLPIIDGIHETIEVLEKAGVIPIIVTTSNVLFAECFKEMYNFSEVYGTIHEIFPNGRVGVGIEVCSSRHKIQHVNKLVSMLGGTMNEVFAVGDSVSDIPLFEEVGCSIAFNYDELMENKADIYVRSNNIFSIFDNIGEKYEVSRKY